MLSTTRASISLVVLTPLLLAVLSCRAPAGGPSTTDSKPGAESVTAFLKDANDTLLSLGKASNEAGWVQSTFITTDTQAISARTNDAYVTAATNYAKKAATFPASIGTPDEQRQLSVLKNTMTMAAPANAAEATEMTRLGAALEAAYGSGKYCPSGAEAADSCLDIEAVTKILAENRDPKRLREVWEGWHTISPPMKKDYVRFAELMNKGAKEIGFADNGVMWRSRYDLSLIHI